MHVIRLVVVVNVAVMVLVAGELSSLVDRLRLGLIGVVALVALAELFVEVHRVVPFF